ncbi:MAG: hypothetical protein AAFR76_00345 [Planctomycetota bacterium]
MYYALNDNLYFTEPYPYLSLRQRIALSLFFPAASLLMFAVSATLLLACGMFGEKTTIRWRSIQYGTKHPPIQLDEHTRAVLRCVRNAHVLLVYDKRECPRYHRYDIPTHVDIDAVRALLAMQ